VASAPSFLNSLCFCVHSLEPAPVDVESFLPSIDPQLSLGTTSAVENKQHPRSPSLRPLQHSSNPKSSSINCLHTNNYPLQINLAVALSSEMREQAKGSIREALSLGFSLAECRIRLQRVLPVTQKPQSPTREGVCLSLNSPDLLWLPHQGPEGLAPRSVCGDETSDRPSLLPARRSENRGSVNYAREWALCRGNSWVSASPRAGVGVGCAP